MTTDDIGRLEMHAGIHPRIEKDGLEGTLAGMLRPYSGLDRGILGEVRELAARVLSHRYDADHRLRAVAAVLSTTQLVRGSALDPGSMLSRNRLMDRADAQQLLEWTQGMEELALELCDQEVWPAPGREIRLTGKGNTLVLSAGAWCHVHLVDAEHSQHLGADNRRVLVQRLRRALREANSIDDAEIDGVSVCWVLSLVEPRCSIYMGTDDSGHKHVFVQDDQDRTIGHLEVDSEQTAEWLVQLRGVDPG